MSSTRFVSLLACLVTALLAACSHGVQPGQAAAAARPLETVVITLTQDDFLSKGPRHRKLDVQLRVGQQLRITLASNPSTGHVWARESDLGDQGLLRQTAQDFVALKLPVPGAGGTERWVLEAVKPGSTVTRLGYGRPTVQGDLAWSLMVNVQVKP